MIKDITIGQFFPGNSVTVSYTHLDVYKRQKLKRGWMDRAYLLPIMQSVYRTVIWQVRYQELLLRLMKMCIRDSSRCESV